MADDFGLGHSKSESLLDRGRIPLYFGRPFYVAEALVPKVLPLCELPEVCKLVNQIEVQVKRVTVSVVILDENDRADLIVDPDITITRLDPHAGRVQEAAQRRRRRLDAAGGRTLHETRQERAIWVLSAGKRPDHACIVWQFDHIVIQGPASRSGPSRFAAHNRRFFRFMPASSLLM